MMLGPVIGVKTPIKVTGSELWVWWGKGENKRWEKRESSVRKVRTKTPLL